MKRLFLVLRHGVEKIASEVDEAECDFEGTVELLKIIGESLADERGDFQSLDRIAGGNS